jgi:hypothetical protein
MSFRHVAPLLALLMGCSSGASPAPAGDGGSAASTAGDGDSGSGAADSGAATDGAAGPDTWTSYAAGFFKTYCTECHDAKDATGRDYTLQAKVEADKLPARCGVAVTQDPSWGCATSPVAKQFPIGTGAKPSDAERTRIVAWITAGAP